MKKTFILLLIVISYTNIWSQQQYQSKVTPTKNLIVMIPDGTSIGVVSAARWYQIFNNGSQNLAIDPYMCGTVKTYSSDAPIGDSAPTTSCYMTGVPQQAGNISIYPVSTANDLVPLDPTKAYQPLTTLLEAMKIEQKKATGLVVTVEFPHATPADCAAHHYNRGDYKNITAQMAYNHLDLMFGGGASLITDDMREQFHRTSTNVIINNVHTFRHFNGEEKIWALFSDMNLPYDLDRDPEQIPSLSEMTQKAIDRLSKNENGFFLMVEGSQIDYNAHGNDAVGCITEYLAFDKAVAVAIEYAKKDGNTTVVILPDHGNSGFTIGRRDMPSYGKASLKDLFGNVSKFKKTGRGLESILLDKDTSEFRSIINQYTDITLTNEEWNTLISSRNYQDGKFATSNKTGYMGENLVRIMNSRTYFGFTSGGHTGEEVFLAAYHPTGDLPIGMNTNIEINQYLFDVSGLHKTLPEITDEIFAKHTDVFWGYDYSIEKNSDSPLLIVKKNKKELKIHANKSVVYVNNKLVNLQSVVVYIDKNDTFYLPKALRSLLQ